MTSTWALVAILCAGAALRFFGIYWDGGSHLHPDERFVTQVASAIKVPPLGQYFDTARSAFNPNGQPNTSYVYGTLPLFTTRVIAEVVSTAARGLAPADTAPELIRRLRDLTGYDEIDLLGRGVSAVSDLFTIVLVFMIGRHVYGRAVGLVAALLTAFCVLMIQTAHFFTVEAMLTLFITLAFYLAIRASESGSLTHWSLFGVATGLAAGSKVSALMLGVVGIGAALVYWYRVTRLGENAERRRFLWEDITTGLFVSGALAFATFRFAQPYTFNGPSIFNVSINARWMEVFVGFQRIGTGEGDVPFNQVWAGTTPYLWQLQNMALWGMGIPLAIAAWGGVAFAIYQLLSKPRQFYIHALGIAWILANFVYWGPQLTKLMRYQLPIYPELIIFAALVVVGAWRWGGTRIRRASAPVLDPTAVAPDGALAQPPRSATVGRLARPAARVCAAIVVGWTILYGLAFMSIYSKPLTRLTASDWMVENLPAGSTIGTEHWDDPLPIGPGKDRMGFKTIEMPLYAEEVPDKRTEIISRLDQVDYIALSSNRLYGSIPRNPRRFPLGTRYYQALFDGELGFERVKDFTSRPSLFGIELNDDNAEESFTVYDHPKVTIFKKTSQYSTELAHSIFDPIPVEQALHNLRPINAGSTGLLLDAATWATDRAGGTWSAIFDRESLPNRLPLPIWYLTIELLGLLAFPATWFVCRRLSDAGYPLAKTLAIVAVAYLPWLFGSFRILPFSRLSILVALLLLALVSVLVVAKQRAALVADLKLKRLPIMASEAIFLVVFAVFTALRLANPDLWHSAYGGEKPMDFAYLNAVIKTTWFPAYDPWFAGGYLNYYYFGQVIVGSLVKLTGIVPWVAYNLAIPTIAALVGTSLASAVYNLLISHPAAPTRRKLWAVGGGVAAILLGEIGGNLHAIQQYLTWLMKLDPSPIHTGIPAVASVTSVLRGLSVWITGINGGNLPPFNFDFWGPTRVITTEATAPITEFPYFTFLYGDLHAHMIGMPLGLLAVGLTINLIRQPAWVPPIFDRPGREVLRAIVAAARTPGAITLFLLALDIGVMRMTNSWDFPTYLGLTGAAVLLVESLRRPFDWKRTIGRSIVLAAGVMVASSILITPYLKTNELFYTGVQLTQDRSTAAHYIVIMGSFLAVVATYLGFRLAGVRDRIGNGLLLTLGSLTGGGAAQAAVATDMAPPRSVLRPASSARAIDGWVGAIAVVTVVFAIVLFLAGRPVVGIVLIGLSAFAIAALLIPVSSGTAFLYLLAATALAITGGVEVFVLKGDIGRMNTVFKFYLQAWLFLSIVSGAFLAILVRRLVGSPWLRGGRRRAVGIALAAILLVPFLYTIEGTPPKVSARFEHTSPTLDGMEYMSVGKYGDEKGDMVIQDDYKAINWMLDNIQGSPVIVEGIAPLYHWRARVSVYTGLPTVIGWDWHQTQQRGDFSYMVGDRVKDNDAIYTTTSADETRKLLDRYLVEYVYVGGLERAYYPSAGIDKFETMVGPRFEKVYSQGVVTIYHVVR